MILRFPPQSTSTERPGPSFLHGSSANQTLRQVPLGSTVYLDCRVKELQDYQVSIGRRAEEKPINITMSWQILTFGKKMDGIGMGSKWDGANGREKAPVKYA